MHNIHKVLQQNHLKTLLTGVIRDLGFVSSPKTLLLKESIAHVHLLHRGVIEFEPAAFVWIC